MIGRAFASIGNFGVLLFLFIYIFALMGMQFFGNTMRFDDQGYPTPHTVDAFWNGTVPRSNFDTLPWAIATVFQVITGDNWSAVLYDAIRGNGMIASLYFIILQVMLGDFVLMNLFLAGDVFDSLSSDQKAFLVSPAPWDALSEIQRSWFSSSVCEGFPTEELTSQYVCECWGAAWKPVLSKNFDNVGSAMLTFFILSTSENWSEIMKAACDATSPSMQPIVNHNDVWIVFYIAFMVVGSFFVMNVFVGVIIDNFNTMKAKLGGDFLLTPEQKKWMEANKSATRIGPIRMLKAPIQVFRRLCFQIVRTRYFETFVMGCILTNTLLMATQHFGESPQQLSITYVVSELSTEIFFIEAVMKILAYGRAYFEDNWNRFDFLIVIGTVFGTIAQTLASSSLWTLTTYSSGSNFPPCRVFQQHRAILSTLYISLPGLSNITSILFLILFVYSTMGVHLFAKVALTSDIDSHANFQSFGVGFLFLLRAASGESWDHCMYDLASSTSGCVSDPPYDPDMCGFNNSEDCKPLNGCGNPVAYIFFCSFTIIVSYVMLNLTVAVVLEGFASSQQEDDDAILVPELLDEFQYKWAELDPVATGFIRVDKMLQFINSVAPPLGWFGIPLPMPQCFRYMYSLRIPLYDGELVHFRDVIMAMTREMIKATNNWSQGDVPNDNSAGHPTRGSSHRKFIGFYAHEYLAARYLQRRVTMWLVRRRQLEKKKTGDFIRKMKKLSKKPQRDKKLGDTLVLPMVKRRNLKLKYKAQVDRNSGQSVTSKMNAPRRETVVAAELHRAKRDDSKDQDLRKCVGADYAVFTLLSRENWLRRRCIRVVSHVYFDRFITFCIVLNSVVLATTDFSVVDSKLKPVSRGKKFQNGELVDAYSFANHVSETLEFILTGIFTSECVLKIVALGVKGKGSYWSESWNVIDFTMLFTSFVAEIPGMPNVSEFRSFCVLRPLRSLTMFPGMRRLTSALLNAIPALYSVVGLQLFAFLMFGILGVEFFSGRMSRVCRLTEFPVRLPPGDNLRWPVTEDYLNQVLVNASAFRCLEAPLLDYSDQTFGFTKETSPWRTPQNCFWPVYSTDGRLCAEPLEPGGYQCPSGSTCGSNYDTFGNPRFRDELVMKDALHTSTLNWGYTTYDNIGRAFLTIFQSVTEEGWTLIMYMTMDASYPAVGACFAVALIVFASYFVMNLTIAVINEEFQIDKPVTKRSIWTRWGSQRRLLPSNSDVQPSLLRRLVSHWLFSRVTMFMVFANTAVFAIDHYPMSQSMNMKLEVAHIGFLGIFTLEMTLKLAGLGWRDYVRDQINLFDAVIVFSDIVEVLVRPPSLTIPASGADTITLLRSFRLLRLFRLARHWPSFRNLLEMIAQAVTSIGNFSVLLFLFIYIFALLGMQFFGNTMRFDELGYSTPHTIHEFWNGTVPRSNFDTLPWAIATVFQVITGDNWSLVLYDSMRGNGMFASIYFIVLQVMLGDFVLMNLFLAMLLDNFSTRSESRGNELETNSSSSLAKRRSSKISPIEANKQRIIRRMAVRRTGSTDLQWLTSREDNSARTELASLASQRQLTEHLSRFDSSRAAAMRSLPREDTGISVTRSLTTTASNRHNNLELQKDGSEEKQDFEHLSTQSVKQPMPRGNSLFIFNSKSRVRQWAFKLSSNSKFETLVFTLIVISSIVLAVENPLRDPNSVLSKFILRLDEVFAALFLLEMSLKIVSLGFVMHEGAYLRDSWNAVDGFVTITSIVLLFAHIPETSDALQSLGSLRDLRALRPLRMISRRPGLKLIVSALVKAIPSVLNVVFLSMILFLLFSITAVHFLKGTFQACSGDVFNSLLPEQIEFLVSPTPWNELSSLQQKWFENNVCKGFLVDEITSQYICECWGADWKPTQAKNFNNVASAMLTFFVLSTSENWSEIMTAACDATGPGMQPIINNNEIWIAFFILFMVVGSFFLMNVFVGVVIDNFNSMKAKLGGDFLLTPEQKKWMEAQKIAKRVGPIRILKVPAQPVRRICFSIVRNHYFEGFIMTCIVANALLMAAQHFGESTQQLKTTYVVSELSTVIFALEAAMKLMAYGRAYFDDNWNRFDFSVVVGTVICTIVQVLVANSIWTLTMLVRLMRVTRIFRLVESSSSIRAILSTLYIALPGLSNISSILFLILFVYGTMGVHLFAKVALSSDIDAHANFQTFGRSILFLLRVATGESWDHCMYDLASNVPGCVNDPPYDPNMCGFGNIEGCIPLNGCGNPVAYLFFCSFTVIVAYVMLNLTVAVVLESFATCQEEEEDSMLVPELLEEFQYKWAELDPMATGFIKVDKLLTFVHKVAPPLGWFGIPLQMPQFFRYTRSLHLPLYEGELVQFRDVVMAMTREMINTTNNWALTDESKLGDDVKKTGGASNRKPTEFYAHEYFAARYLQRRVQNWLVRKRQLEKKKTRDFIRKMKKQSKKPRKDKKHGETLVLPMVKRVPNALQEASRHF
ncbi:hypothetical protein PF004_g5659 [Phytophthora fragariae]|uniref:Uncharacterized protein n=1 Tax=Phytophthora fragariae TaxID=53985 RepID=A0A6G0PEU5_9STRA|nr:hypothetical protein PF004_g5659 [Phytophthora fragariae]